MKYLVLLLVVGVVLAWLSIARRRSRGERSGPGGAGAGPRRDAPTAMLGCVHCGVHLPRPEALFDAAGRPYCSEAHRLGGPR